MFSKKQRVNREKIGKIFEKPDFFINSNNITLRASKNNLPFPRFAVVISKKVEKSAVKRHFLKRNIIYLIKEININKNIDFVFSLKNKNTKQLKEEIANLVNKCIIE